MQALLLVVLLAYAANAQETTPSPVRQAAHETALINTLFPDGPSSLTSVVRPTGDAKGTVHVALSYNSVVVSSVDELDGHITISFWESMSWNDERLAWNPADHNGVHTIKIPTSYIWLPDISYPNLHSSAMSTEAEHKKAVVLHDGTVIYIPTKTIRHKCNFDMSHFPWDTQQCTISILSWVHTKDEIAVTTAPSFPSDVAIPHTDWEITAINLTSEDKIYECCPETYQTIYLDVTMKRNPHFYFYLFVIPSTFIMACLPFIHIFPPGCSQKTTIAGLLMVSSFLLHLMILNQLGTFAEDTTPHIVNVFTKQMLFIVFSIAVSSITASIANASHSTCRLPRPIRMLISLTIGRICCFGPTDVKGDFMRLQDQVHGRPSDSVRYDPHGDMSPIVDHPDAASHQPDHNSTEDMKAALSGIMDELRHARERKQMEREWYQLAVIIDRLAAILFGLYAIITTISLESYNPYSE